MKVLLLAGTGDARRLADLLAQAPGVEASASLAGATRAPTALPIPTRTGGFGGEAEQEKFMRDNGFEAVVDATHPFAHRISARTQTICARLGLPYLQLLHPGWTPGPGDDWTMLSDEAAAAALVPPGSTVFCATGRQTLERFTGLDAYVIFRQIDPPTGPFPLAQGEFLLGRPPFSVEDETCLFRDRGVDVLIVKNAGGAASRTKLDAARALGIPVLMIARPPQPPGDKVETPAEAMAWLAKL